MLPFVFNLNFYTGTDIQTHRCSALFLYYIYDYFNYLWTLNQLNNYLSTKKYQ